MERQAAGCVLVVEDSWDFRYALAALLEAAGFEVETAEGGREAVERVHRRTPCLVLLDLIMPVADGWEFLRQRACDRGLAGVPVVVLTAADGEHRPAAEGLGADGFLEKPVAADTLLDTVRRYCRRQPAAPPTQGPG